MRSLFPCGLTRRELIWEMGGGFAGVALAGLLAATLFHALRLERALGVLKRDRSALEQMVAEFNNAIAHADGSIEHGIGILEQLAIGPHPTGLTGILDPA